MPAAKTSKPAPEQAVRLLIDRVPQTDDELWMYVYTLTGFAIPRHASDHPDCVAAGHVAPFDAFADAFFARHTLSIWKGSRGLGGKSRTLAILSLIETIIYGTEVRLLGGSGAQSQNLLDASREAWASRLAPTYLLGKEGAGALAARTRLENGGDMSTLNASENQVRGPHPPRLRMDEIDVMKWTILESALGMPMDQVNRRGEEIIQQTVMSSTHQNANGTMTKMLERAKDPEQGIAVFEWCFRETSTPAWMCEQDPTMPHPKCSWLTEEAIARKKRLVSAAMWRNEFEMQEPSIEGRAIDQLLIEDAFDPFLEYELGYKKTPIGDDGLPDRENLVYDETETPIQVVISNRRDRHVYVTGIDWAQSKDRTIVATYDATDPEAWHCVAWQAFNQESWPAMVDRAVKQWRRYGGLLVHDATGIGAGAHDLILEHADVTRAEAKQVRGTKLSADKTLYREYVVALENGSIKYPRIAYAFDEHRYATEGDLYGTKSEGHAPDSVVAGALAWSIRAEVNSGPPLHAFGGGSKAAGWVNVGAGPRPAGPPSAGGAPAAALIGGRTSPWSL